MRPVSLEPGVAKYAEGSCLAKFGDTHVLCTASVEERVPPFLRNTGKGWVTAEYGMLPRSTATRTDREAARGRQSGRTQEIQRLIGRSLRAVTDLTPARRAPDQDRLRCIAGRRRHAYSRGHRQLCGAPSGVSAVAFGGSVEGAAVARQCRRGLLRRHCRHRRARSRLCRRFAGDDRRQLRADRNRRDCRDPGDRRGRAVR